MTITTRALRAACILAGGAFLLAGAGASSAMASPAGSIDHIESAAGVEHVLFSIHGLSKSASPDLGSVRAMVNGHVVHATATPASQNPGLVERTAVLAIDSSNSMTGERIAAAKAAARAFIAQAPSDVRIGIVSFAGTVRTVQAPTTDKQALNKAIQRLTLSNETHLYQGIEAGLKAAGHDGQRDLLVLSDGRDTTGAPLSSVVSAVEKSGTHVDIVGISVNQSGVDTMSRIAHAGNGTLVNAADTSALGALLRSEAQTLAKQVLISFPIPRTVAGTSANLVVSIKADGQSYTDSAFVMMGKVPAPKQLTPIPDADASKGSGASSLILIAGVVAIGLGLLLVAAMALGVFRPEQSTIPEDLLAGYGGLTPQEAEQTALSMRESAVDLTARALHGGSLEEKLRRKLDAAGLSMKPAEWLLIHAGIAGGIGFAGYLLTSGNRLIAILLLLVGAVIPWIYLGTKENKRIRAFNAQLADALQLMAGGLKAGLSLSQSIDSIVAEGIEPMASEFRRALVEARLGMDVEDALENVAIRMKSADFRWVIMAVRIQRQVGGNLAELLLTVAATLREREYLRRQIRSLSAEGRLSAYVLCGMPPMFLLYLQVSNPDLLHPMFHTVIGYALMAVAAVMMCLGMFWMSRVVKVEV